MRIFRAHVYFEACASFDVAAESRAVARLIARDWFENLPGAIIDTTVEVEGKQVHIEDVSGGINEIGIEEDPYEPEDLCPST